MLRLDAKPLAVKRYEVKQHEYEQVLKLPWRGRLLGASHSGKGILLQIWILDIYEDGLERVCIFAPSINVDQTSLPVKSHLDNEISLSEDEPELYYDHYHTESLEHMITTPRKIVEHQNTNTNNGIIFNSNCCWWFCGLKWVQQN